jgi:hypothetical protein
MTAPYEHSYDPLYNANHISMRGYSLRQGGHDADRHRATQDKIAEAAEKWMDMQGYRSATEFWGYAQRPKKSKEQKPPLHMSMTQSGCFTSSSSSTASTRSSDMRVTYDYVAGCLKSTSMPDLILSGKQPRDLHKWTGRDRTPLPGYMGYQPHKRAENWVGKRFNRDAQRIADRVGCYLPPSEDYGIPLPRKA